MGNGKGKGMERKSQTVKDGQLTVRYRKPISDRAGQDRVEGRREERSEEDQRRLEGGGASASASASAQVRSNWVVVESRGQNRSWPWLRLVVTERTERIIKMDPGRGTRASDDPIQAYTDPSRRGLKHQPQLRGVEFPPLAKTMRANRQETRKGKRPKKDQSKVRTDQSGIVCC